MPRDATRTTRDYTMTQRETPEGNVNEHGLLIRRSWVRPPSGSSSSPATLGAGDSAGVDPAIKRRARVQVGNALKSGALKQGPCEQADAACSGPIQAHHDDYTKPLSVRWLCRGHHFAGHRKPRRACYGCFRVMPWNIAGHVCSAACAETIRADQEFGQQWLADSTTCAAFPVPQGTR